MHRVACRMDSPDHITLTKVEAAVIQIEAAIEATRAGQFAVAITLAGAAEDMLGNAKSMFHYHRNHPRVPELNMTNKEFGNELNRERDWLKHPSDPDPMEFTRYGAEFMIARAVTTLKPENCTDRIRAFWDHWVAQHS